MDIIPAIDLMGGKCVRLHKGDFDEQTIYADFPLDVAKELQQEGAKLIHIVDLDGAKEEKSAQIDIVKEIVTEVNVKVQSGGGIRSAEKIQELLDAGIDRVVIGSLATKNPTMVKKWLEKFGSEKIVLAFDIKMLDGMPMIAISGWQENTQISLWDILLKYQQSDLKYVLCTDVDKDGTLAKPNFELYRKMRSKYSKFYIQASGGVASLADIRMLKEIGVNAVIIGKALYENKFTLTEALQC